MKRTIHEWFEAGRQDAEKGIGSAWFPSKEAKKAYESGHQTGRSNKSIKQHEIKSSKPDGSSMETR